MARARELFTPKKRVNILKKVKVNGTWKFCPAVTEASGKLKAFPRRGRPANRPWAKKRPIRVTREFRSLAVSHPNNLFSEVVS